MNTDTKNEQFYNRFYVQQFGIMYNGAVQKNITLVLWQFKLKLSKSRCLIYFIYRVVLLKRKSIFFKIN